MRSGSGSGRMLRSSSSNWTAIRVISISSSAKSPDEAQTAPARREMALGLSRQPGPRVIGWRMSAVSSAFIWGRPGGTCVSEGVSPTRAGPRGIGPLVRLSRKAATWTCPEPCLPSQEGHSGPSAPKGRCEDSYVGWEGAYRRGTVQHHGCHFISSLE